MRALLPQTATEKRWFDAVSVTAGICEEIIYRGFLFAYFAAWLPGAAAGVVIVLAGLVFGLGHLYQGAAGIVKIDRDGGPVRCPLLDDRFSVGADAPARRRRSEQRMDQLADRARRWPRRQVRAGRGVGFETNNLRFSRRRGTGVAVRAARTRGLGMTRALPGQAPGDRSASHAWSTVLPSRLRFRPCGTPLRTGRSLELEETPASCRRLATQIPHKRAMFGKATRSVREANGARPEGLEPPTF